MKDKDIDFLIVKYLQSKKYSNSERVFRADARFDADAPGAGAGGAASQALSLTHQLDSDHSLQDLLLFYAAEKEPRAFVEGFDALVAFVDASLDLYKAELQRVLYPVFVHVYLALVSYGAPAAAADLLRRYRRRLVEVGGRASSVRGQELLELQAVALPQHLDVSPFAKAARAHRSSLRLCTYAFELLMHHLQGTRQWLILNIINKHVAFELHEGAPLLLDVSAGGEEGTGLLQGRAGEATGAINSMPLDLALLKDSSEDAHAARRLQEEEEKLSQAVAAAAAAASAAQAAEQAGAMDVDGEQQLSLAAQQAAAAARRLKAHKERALSGARARLKAMQDSRRAPTVSGDRGARLIPLLPLHERVARQQADDLAARVTLSPPSTSHTSAAAGGDSSAAEQGRLPSCCFFTVVNSRHGGVTAMTASHDSKHLAVGFSDSVVRLYQLSQLGKQRRQLKDRRAAAAKRQQQHRAAAAAAGGELGVDVDTELAELQEELAELSEQQVTHLYGHSGSITGLDYSADQSLLFSSSTDGTVRLWSSEMKRGLAAYRGHVYPVWGVAACPHGTYLATAGADQTARLWSTEMARPLRIFTGHQSDVDVVAWHPNSHYLATGSSDRSLRLWEAASGACVRVLTAQTSCITSLAFSPDGSQLAAGTEDGTVAVYDIGSARRMALLEGHVGPVWSLSYSRGAGSILASGGADRTLRLFSCPRGASVLELVNDELLAAATQVQHAGEGGGGASGGAAGASGGAAGASGGAAGGGDAAAAAGGHQQHQQHHQWQPWQLLETYTTQAMPVIYASFSPRNLLRAGGPWTLPPKTVGGGVAGVVGVGI